MAAHPAQDASAGGVRLGAAAAKDRVLEAGFQLAQLVHALVLVHDITSSCGRSLSRALCQAFLTAPSERLSTVAISACDRPEMRSASRSRSSTSSDASAVSTAIRLTAVVSKSRSSAA